MEFLDIHNPFSAPVYHFETLGSTMDEARRLAAGGACHGTVVTADFQEAGRGRTAGRPWKANRGENLFFTIILQYGSFDEIPKAITLKTGLAVSLAVEDFAPALRGAVMVKWPNDVMIALPAAPGADTAQTAGKAAGILTESDGKIVYIGVGVNVGQTGFPPEFRSKAASIALALEAHAPEKGGLGEQLPQDAPLLLLEKILSRLFRELASDFANPAGSQSPPDSWRARLEERLYLKGKPVRFLAGGADQAVPVRGILAGTGPLGELLIIPQGKTSPEAFTAGELDVYRYD